MKIPCVWEHNGNDSILYADNFEGAFTRGASLEEAMRKMPEEIRRFQLWRSETPCCDYDVEIVQEKASKLPIRDADSDVLFLSEEKPLRVEEYQYLKALALKSAGDFYALYRSFPDKHRSVMPFRQTFYGAVPRTAEEMYQHTKNVNEYYFSEIGAEADNEGTIVSCRARGFEALEAVTGYLSLEAVTGSYDEQWSVRKVLRRFIWHDRIHAKALYRMGIRTFGADAIPDIFGFTR
ncbi:MAG: hypothetical protein IJQ17_08715 [Oscillospiraceae bacterium]|nr:hypothetical protein [Oscillospiraceae bacterium]MBQ6974891.1 hypothetical protein [Oscillospiraceae bacterium]